MTQYIDKSALVAEIEKKKKLLPWGSCASQISMECNCKNETYNEVLSFLNTLEMKEMDLEKEFYDFLDTLIGKDNGYLSEDELFSIAKHFYELGLKSKGE